jgi:hypothetical protein
LPWKKQPGGSISAIFNQKTLACAIVIDMNLYPLPKTRRVFRDDRHLFQLPYRGIDQQMNMNSGFILWIDRATGEHGHDWPTGSCHHSMD